MLTSKGSTQRKKESGSCALISSSEMPAARAARTITGSNTESLISRHLGSGMGLRMGNKYLKYDLK